MRIYTRTGDDGSTSLFGGDRVPKANLRLEAYGTLDELNCILGLLRLNVSEKACVSTKLEKIQADLFILGAMLATPLERQDALENRMHRGTWAIEAMEADIDRLTDLVPPLKAFVLPGGSPGASWAHLARTVCRRAERIIVSLAAQEHVPSGVVAYVNRLSDWLFALARAENALAGVPDTEWEP